MEGKFNRNAKIDSEIQVDSLNASGAAAIGMWELYKNHD